MRFDISLGIWMCPKHMDVFGIRLGLVLKSEGTSLVQVLSRVVDICYQCRGGIPRGLEKGVEWDAQKKGEVQ